MEFIWNVVTRWILLRVGIYFVGGALILAGLPISRGQGGESENTPMGSELPLIERQEPPRMHPRVLEEANQGRGLRLLVSLQKQRAYLMVGEEVAIDTPVSTGKVAGKTPVGQFRIVEKNSFRMSKAYGDFVERGTGRVVRAGVSVRLDVAPSGTVFRPVEMRWFLGLGGDDFGVHAGRLPGYAASDVNIRLPEEIAKVIYELVSVGSLVEVAE